MKKLILLSTFFISISVYALPNCPSDISVRWDNCFGNFNYTNGDKYVGEWKDDKQHGQGTYTFGPGEFYGDVYVGEYKDGMYHGQGTYTFASGDKYVGEFKDNLWHGQGTYTFADGERWNGYFMNGDYIPRICENMGLRKGSDEFGKCVNELVRKL